MSLFRSSLRVKSDSGNTQSHNKSQGKTYVTGDIHGMYGTYMDIMKKMTPEDCLIILGDVIDRGTGGIKIIQDILKRKQDKKHNPEIVFLPGNHEMQFLDIIEIMKRSGLQREDFKTIFTWHDSKSQVDFYELLNDGDFEEQQEYWQGQLDRYDVLCNRLKSEKELDSLELEVIGIWLNSNQGDKTIFDFLNIKNDKEQRKICEFLKDSYVVLPKTIQNRDYLFVHSVPLKDHKMIAQMKQTKKGYRYRELKRKVISFMLEKRDDSAYALAKKYEFTTICGHTPKYGCILRDEEKGFIRIDAGCGHQKEESKAALYCVEDDSVEYFAEKETDQYLR